MKLLVLKKHLNNVRIKKLVKEGMQVGKGSLLFASKNSFGSEPYLIHIGEDCIIADGVTFITHDGAIRVINNKEECKRINNKYGKIEIKDRVYIGENSIIMPNVTIGPNSVVLPGSVIYNDVPANTISSGNPAKAKNRIEDFETYYHTEIYPYYQKYFEKFYKFLFK